MQRQAKYLALGIALMFGFGSALAQDIARPFEIDPSMMLPTRNPDIQLVRPTPSAHVIRENGEREPVSSDREAQADERQLAPQVEIPEGTYRRAPGTQRTTEDPYEYGRLVVLSEFPSVLVTVEGVPYTYGTEGVLLIAHEQYQVVLETMPDDGGETPSDAVTRVIQVRLTPGETRVLMANLGDGQPLQARQARRQPTTRQRETRRSSEPEEDEEIGYLGVSSSPRGIVYVDGENTGQMTPARRIELGPGRHEVRIFYESEDTFSETKNVLIRSGVNTNVFFRYRPEEAEEGSISD